MERARGNASEFERHAPARSRAFTVPALRVRCRDTRPLANLIFSRRQSPRSNQHRYFEGFGGGTSIVEPILEEASSTLFLDSASLRTPDELALTPIRKSR